MNFLKQSTAVDVLVGPFVDITDGSTAETAETPSVKLSKNGQTLAAKSGSTPTHDADGYYNCELGTADTDTVGTLVLTVAASATALPVRHEFQVVSANVYDSLYASSGTDILQVETTTNSDKTGYSISGTKTTLDALNDIAATDIVSGGAITTSAGAVSNVTTVATTTTNTDMRGTDSALLASAAPTNFGDLAITATTGLVDVNDKTGYSISGVLTTLDALDTAQDTQHTSTQSDIAALNDLSAAQVNTEVDTALTDYDAPTKAELDAGFAALNDITATDVWAAATRTLTAGTNLNDLSTTDILGMAYEGSEDFQDFLRLMRAVLLGKTSGAGTGTENFRDAADSKNRVTSTIDGNGDRTAIATDAT